MTDVAVKWPKDTTAAKNRLLRRLPQSRLARKISGPHHPAVPDVLREKTCRLDHGQQDVRRRI
jgi:hypothetical protein